MGAQEAGEEAQPSGQKQVRRERVHRSCLWRVSQTCSPHFERPRDLAKARPPVPEAKRLQRTSSKAQESTSASTQGHPPHRRTTAVRRPSNGQAGLEGVGGGTSVSFEKNKPRPFLNLLIPTEGARAGSQGFWFCPGLPSFPDHGPPCPCPTAHGRSRHHK